MQGYIAAFMILLLIALVLARAIILKRIGVKVLSFGKIDKKDFLIPPFAIFYFYLVFANAFGFPTISNQQFFISSIISWFGVLLCFAGLTAFLFSLVSFGKSFRVGIDSEQPDKLVTNGIFAVSRNPIYVAFGFILLGQFLIFSNWILLVYAVVGVLLFHRQVLREEAFLRIHYGNEYEEYCKKVRRYL